MPRKRYSTEQIITKLRAFFGARMHYVWSLGCLYPQISRRGPKNSR